MKRLIPGARVGGAGVAPPSPAPPCCLDALGPYRGPCGICGGPDARHRLADAIADRLRAGESAEAVALDYEVQAGVVCAISECYIRAPHTHGASA